MGMQFVQVTVGMFLNLMTIQPKHFYSTSLMLAQSIIKIAESEHSEKWLKKLEEIQAQTHEDINIRLAKAEAIIDGTPLEQWGSSLDELKDNTGNKIKVKGKPLKIVDLYMYLVESYGYVLDAVCDISKEYNMDIKFNMEPGTPAWMSNIQNEP